MGRPVLTTAAVVVVRLETPFPLGLAALVARASS